MASLFTGRSWAPLAFALSTAILLTGCEEAMVVVPPEVVAGSVDATRSASPYLEDRIMVLPAPGSRLSDIAKSNDLRVVRSPSASGYAMLEVRPDGMKGSLHRLARDPKVRAAYRVGAIRGTFADENPWLPGPWHFTAIDRPQYPGDLSEWVVAVLDTGVAYERRWSRDGLYVQAPSLAEVTFVYPWDFVNNDAHPNDDHQHGTLMASLIASEGAVEGVAPGVSLMPIKVLDAKNSGDEVTLIDGIYHAVDNGADVISMSLTFGQGYIPSPPLLQALQTAHDAGVVMVAAAGNDGAWYPSWPAASPLVISVASGQPYPQYWYWFWTGALAPAPYSNRHIMVDVLAPGGNLEVDVLGDGYVDGLLAESIYPGDPTQTGYWLSAGTSQAAAVVSGAVVHLLDAGAQGDQVVRALHEGAEDGLPGVPFLNGYGAGWVDLSESIEEYEEGDPEVIYGHQVYVALLPYLQRRAGMVRPAARIHVLDADGDPLDWKVFGTFSGTSFSTFGCRADTSGVCTVVGGAEPATDDSGAPRALSWAVSVDAVRFDDVAYRPQAVVFATDALEVFLAAAAEEPELDDAVLAFYWGNTTDPVLGDIAQSVTVVNTGAGLASSPIGVVFTLPCILEWSTIEGMNLDLDGTGLASSPIGLRDLGIRDLGLAVIEGTGLASSPIGLGARTIYTPFESPYDSAFVHFDSDPVLLSSGIVVGADASSTAVGDWVDGGGWLSSGYDGASLLIGTGVVDATASVAGSSGTGAQPVGD
jgi:hypothetical protein